ncbi:MAG: chloride channel protein [Bacteroidia bacterium]|nr:chloride channel protein [Bacteroidia bacterium]
MKLRVSLPSMLQEVLRQSLKPIYQKISNYLRIRFNRVQFMMFVASVVGLVAGLIAVVLKILVHAVQEMVEKTPGAYLYLFLPVAGLLITVFLIKKFYGGHIEKGIAMVLHSIAKKSSFIPLKHNYVHVVTSTITVGLGGSAGLEAPIVATGSAIGSTVGRFSFLNNQERTLLIACGAAAGIAAVFNAPIAGVIFAIEVLLTETIVSYFIPLITAAVIGTLCSKIILNESILFNFVLQETFDYHNLHFYMLLGILAGFMSLYYARIYTRVESTLHEKKWNVFYKAIAGGLILMAIYFLFPPLFGEGYPNVKMLANNQLMTVDDNTTLFSYISTEWALIIFTGCILFLKPVVAGITIGSGGNGGNFAPSLFVGSYLGYVFSKLLNATGFFRLPESNFSLVGMAGVLSGVMYCPLTAIFLIAEITNGYELIIPLMIVSIISYFIVKHFEPFSMETKKLALGGQIFTHKKERNILTSLELKSLLTETYLSVSIDKNLEHLVEVIKKSEKNIFAVEDEKGKFAGMIELNDIKKQLFQPDSHKTIPVTTLMKKPPATLHINEDMTLVMGKFDTTQSWYLPVLDNERKFMGFLSKTKLFNEYRKMISAQSDLYEES